MYDLQRIAIENNLSNKLLLSATLRMKVRYALRLLLRDIRVSRGQTYYKLVEKSFFWINGQYGYGLVGIGSESVIKTLNHFYSLFVRFPQFNLNLIEMPDQYIHAEVLLELYELSKNEMLLPLIHQAANNLKNEVELYGKILRYGNGKMAYIDTLGMITEFCYHYDRIFGVDELSQIAEDQMDFFISAACSESEIFPYHAYEIESGGKKHSGSNSWGRGIGWYLLGLGACVANNPEKYSAIFIDTMMHVFSKQDQNGFLYEDMITRERIDTSTTSMAALSLYYGLRSEIFEEAEKIKAEIYLERAISALVSATTEDGRVLFCTGECGGANVYSKEYGDYYAQGYTLRLMTMLERNGV